MELSITIVVSCEDEIRAEEILKDLRQAIVERNILNGETEHIVTTEIVCNTKSQS